MSNSSSSSVKSLIASSNSSLKLSEPVIFSSSSIRFFKGISISSSKFSDVEANGRSSTTSISCAGSAAAAAGSRPISSVASCSKRTSTASLISFEYFSNTNVSAFLTAASFNAVASIIACCSISDILFLLETVSHNK